MCICTGPCDREASAGSEGWGSDKPHCDELLRLEDLADLASAEPSIIPAVTAVAAATVAEGEGQRQGEGMAGAGEGTAGGGGEGAGMGALTPEATPATAAGKPGAENCDIEEDEDRGSNDGVDGRA